MFHRFVENDVVQVKQDLRSKARFGKGPVVVLKDMRGIVKSNQSMFGSTVVVEFVNGVRMPVDTELLRVDQKAFSLLP